MHEFLLSLKRWQLSTEVQKPLQAIANKEAKCVETCKVNAGVATAGMGQGEQEASFEQCKAECQRSRSDVERYMYRKESQFLQQLYKECYQAPEDKQGQKGGSQQSALECYMRYNENLQLIKEDLTEYLNEKANEA